MTGVVKAWRNTFGFIIPDTWLQGDVYVHHLDLDESCAEPARKGYPPFRKLYQGEGVEFEIKPDARRPGQFEAINVHLIQPAPERRM